MAYGIHPGTGAMHPRRLAVSCAAAAAVVLAGCGPHGSGSADDTLRFERGSGSVAPELAYADRISTDGHDLVLVRTGGDRVVQGTWRVALTSPEMIAIADRWAAVSATDQDVVTHPPSMPIGGSPERLSLAGLHFLQGAADAPGGGWELHAFAPDVQALADAMLAAVSAHHLDVAYTDAAPVPPQGGG